MVPYPKEIKQAVPSGLDLSVIFYHHHEKKPDNAKMFSIVDQKGLGVEVLSIVRLCFLRNMLHRR